MPVNEWLPPLNSMIHASIDHGDRDFLRVLHRMGSGSVQELCGELGVTATAVRQRLNRLGGMGLVDRQPVRTGRGRPHHEYRLTEDGQRELGDNYALLAQVLWRELHNIEDSRMRSRVLNRVQEALINDYRPEVNGDSPVRRVEQLGAALSERGFDVEVDSSGRLPILRENNCPYHDLAVEDTGICELEQAVFEKVLGTGITRTHCCLEGHTCCEFQPVERDEGSGMKDER